MWSFFCEVSYIAFTNIYKGLSNMFQPLTESENKLILQEGRRIYLELCEKHKEETIAQKDFILNSLCFALLCFMKMNVSSNNYPYFMQLVHKILQDNS
jgi:hypothetical protein